MKGKRILSIVSTVAMVVPLAACGNNTASTPGSAGNAASTTTTKAASGGSSSSASTELSFYMWSDEEGIMTKLAKAYEE